jgi:hypothetical protein
VGTDIEENKCSWLVVQALARVTPEQRQLLQASTILIIKDRGQLFALIMCRTTMLGKSPWSVPNV